MAHSVPQQLWSHVMLDFMPDLCISHCLTVILLAEDTFSKACHLVPLEGLSTAPQTAKVLFQYVVSNKGIPEENVSQGACSSQLKSASPHFSKHQRLEPYAYLLHYIAYLILFLFIWIISDILLFGTDFN